MKNNNSQVNVFLTSLHRLKIHNMCSLTYNSFIKILSIFLLGSLFFSLFNATLLSSTCGILFKYHISMHKMIINLDLKYNAQEQIMAAYLLSTQNSRHPFFFNIINNAQTILFKNILKEKKTIWKTSLIHSFLFIIFISILSFIHTHKNISFDSPKISQKEKQIIQAASAEMKKFAKKWKKIDKKQSKKWLKLSKKWQNKHSNQNKEKLSRDLRQLQKDILKRLAQKNIHTNQQKTNEEKRKDIEKKISKIKNNVEQKTLKSIKKHLANKELQKALDLHKKWHKKKSNSLEKKAMRFIDRLHSKLQLPGKKNAMKQYTSNSNGIEKITKTIAKEKKTITNDPVIFQNQGWIKESLPEKYKHIVYAYLESKKNETK